MQDVQVHHSTQYNVSNRYLKANCKGEEQLTLLCVYIAPNASAKAITSQKKVAPNTGHDNTPSMTQGKHQFNDPSDLRNNSLNSLPRTLHQKNINPKTRRLRITGQQAHHERKQFVTSDSSNAGPKCNQRNS